MTHTSTTVNFGLTSSSESADISLDDDYNRSVYDLGEDETKSTFDPNEIAYLKLLPNAATKPYTLGSSLGDLSLANSNILYDYEEEINFVIEKTGELKYTPHGEVTYRWIGNNGGTPLFSNSLITLPSEVIGILSCSYKAMGDRLKLSNAVFTDDEYPVLCVAIYSDDDNISTTVNFDRGAVPIDVSLEVQVLDMCTGDPIPDATVTIAGIGTGTTDENGIFSAIDKVKTGVSYEIRTSALDYVTSDLDFIKNDKFTIPIMTEEEE